MKQFKNAQVIILPTENENQGIYLNPVPSINKIHYWDKRISNSYIAQHLYIISDDKIEASDFIYNELSGLGQVIKKEEFNEGIVVIYNNQGFEVAEDIKNCKKIISTTDSSLMIYKDYTRKQRGKINLPQSSQQFIEQCIESYNKGQVITEILVEYGNGCHVCEGNRDICKQRINEPHQNLVRKECDSFYMLKINQDNTINIKPIKDSWNREEVERLLYKHTEMMLSGYRDTLDNWIKENL